MSGVHLSAVLEACLPYLSARQPACLQQVSNLRPNDVLISQSQSAFTTNFTPHTQEFQCILDRSYVGL